MARKRNGAQKEPTERELKKIAKAEEKAYYEEAKTWEAELYRSARGRARVWAWIAGLSLLFSIMCVTTLMLVLPLKTAVPYVIEVDRNTGITQVKRSIEDGGISESEAITKFFIVDYLMAREGYMYDRAQEDYVKVQKMSSQPVALQHHTSFEPNNPDSPLNVFGRSGTVEIEIRNVSFIDNDTVTIPIKRTMRRTGTVMDDYEVVTLKYQYLQDPMSEEDRFINPLGFQVIAYRKDPQLLQEDTQ